MCCGLDKESLSSIAKAIDWESVSPAIGKLTTSPSYYLFRLVQALERNMREQLVDFDLTHTQFTMLKSLVALTRDGKVVTQMDLANFLKADKMMVSEVLRTLERKGYIVREKHPSDRRAKSLVVTKKGLDVIEAAIRHAAEFDEKFFSALGDDREEFIRMLKKLL